MADTKKETKQETKTTITYEKDVIQKIIGKSLETVEGLFSIDGGFFSNIKDKIFNNNDVTDGVNVEVGKEQVATDLNIVVEYDKDIPKIVEQMEDIISKQVEKMTHLQVVEVNVKVVDIMTKEEFEKKSVSIQDRLTEATQATGEFISDKAGNIKESFGNGAEKVKETLGNGAEKVKETVENGTEKVKDTLSSEPEVQRVR